MGGVNLWTRFLVSGFNFLKTWGEIINLPLILHYLQEKDEEVYMLFISMQNLEEYTKLINLKSEDNLPLYFKNLKQKTEWADILKKLMKNNKYLITAGFSGLSSLDSL